MPLMLTPLDRQIISLALPALGALVAQPLFILVDSAVIGHVGTTALAGLGLAASILGTVMGLCIFLAYRTTASVARLMGAGHHAQALHSGIQGIWLACGLGTVLVLGMWLWAPQLVAALGSSDAVADQAVTFLRWSAPGLPGMLVVLAATGVLRGTLNTRAPLVVAVSGALINTVATVVLVRGFSLGIVGSAVALAVVDTGMGIALSVPVITAARRLGVNLSPSGQQIAQHIVHGIPLVVRTATLRVAILLTVLTAAQLGAVTLAGHQVVTGMWGLAAFALDALAIAAQALVGQSLGAGNKAHVRRVLQRTIQWGVGAGAVLGITMGLIGWIMGPVFSADPEVHTAIRWGMLACGLLMPLAGWVFVLDGVLIGAGDGRYLAWAGVITLVAYIPAVWAVLHWAPKGPHGLWYVWLGFGVFMLARAITTGWRSHGTAWMITGVASVDP